MWAGGALTFHGDLQVGNAIRRISSIDDIVLKRGRTGELCFVTVSHRIEGNDALVIEERQDIVFRENDANLTMSPIVRAESGEHRRSLGVFLRSLAKPV
jgi:3-methylfumaryl-CoA hydratase